MEINDNGGKMPPSSQNLESDLGPKYTIPGILHFIQHEWARFEMDRAHWEVERAELQARIAFLQGERRGQENLKHDLIRRIKMLEYALKQERGKYHRLKYGTDLVQDKVKEDLKNPESPNDAIVNNSKPGANWRQGRLLLRQYLQEVGYTDTILDVRSSRVRSILGLSAVDPHLADTPILNSLSPKGKHSDSDEAERPGSQQAESLSNRVHAQAGSDVIHPTPVRRAPTRPPCGTRNKNNEEIDSEAAALAGFDFLQNDEDEEENDDDMDDGGSADDESDERDDVREGMRLIKKSKTDLSKDAVEEMLGRDEETVNALEEFGFMMNDSSDSDSTVIELDEDEQHANDFDEVNIHMPEEGEKPNHLSDVPPDSEKDEWGMDQNLLAKLKEQYIKERKVKKTQRRPARSTLQDMLRNLDGDREVPPVAPPTPATQVITGPPPVRLSGSRAVSEVPPLGSITVPGSTFSGSAKSQSESKPHSPPADEPVPLESSLGLGELAGLTVSNEAEPLSYEVSAKDEFRKTWNPKFTLRSHFDPIRSLYFHPTESALITASEDHTLKLWNLQKTIPQKKSNVLDVEPIYTFRGHSGPVLSVAINSTGEMCFSGSADATVLCWNIPSLDVDPYGPYKSCALSCSLVAHTDAVWDLAVQTNSLQLLSCSADGTCRLWSPTLRSPLLQAYQLSGDDSSLPTSVDFVRTEASQMVAAYTSAQCVIYDLETAAPVVKFDSDKTYNSSPATQINKVVSHPTLPVVITAHEDRHIRFFDNNSGKQIHSMVAHLDAVTSLAVDPNGLYLLSGSHDCSIRLWNLDSKTCVQEITSHRKKFDESIYDVAFHPNKPYIASAGADGLAKVFV